MALNEEEQTERQRAADRVSAFLDGPGWVGGVIAREDGHELTVDDLRLLVQGPPPLPPKWSDMLTSPLMHLVLLNGVCMLATRSEERARQEAGKHAGAIMHTVGVQP